eukprot:CAMPEP_0181488316 /NCGR_PEP_ID=MMETSP1110-20121109/48324_1 /TAXON_ID=174948 /ORGANISM="Symbiodinium sp., Strain CCMP421" /LENGTH=77 /DNA_ID=CAMNT_0023614955 /DNA_START=46 /DNA_END=279 /DNA_ORIENTATION=-
MFSILLVVLVSSAGALSSPSSEVAGEGLEAAWQDAKLLLSFAVGIIFVRTLELVMDDGRGPNSEGRLKNLELYPFLT